MLKTFTLVLMILGTYSILKADLSDKLIEKHLKKVNAEKIKTVKSWEYEYESFLNQLNKTEKGLNIFKDSSFYVEQPFTGTFIWNGTTGWYKAPAMQVMDWTVMDEMTYQQIGQQFYSNLELFKGVFSSYDKTKENQAETKFMGSESLGDKKVNKIQLIDTNNKDIEIFVYLGAADDLIHKVQYKVMQGGNAQEFAFLTSDHKVIDGMTFPSKLDLIMGPVEFKTTVLRFVPDAQIDNSKFTKPTN